MASLYAWFDWEDNTTSVNPLSVIEEPRKPMETYQLGEKVLAKLPRYGKWNVVIVEIGECKKELIKHMDARQMMEADAASCNGGGAKDQRKETPSDVADQSEQQHTKKG